jgi:biotin carboxylase
MPRRLLLFVESNTTGTGMLALDTAARLGYQPVFLTANPGRYPGLTRTGVTVLCCDTDSPGELRRAVATLSCGAIAGVTTTSEFYLCAVADLAANLGLPGNPVAVVRTCRDKAATRQALDEAGIPQPRWAVVTSADAVAAAVSRVGLPCVVKPADDSGSCNVRVCVSVDQAREQARTVLAVHHNVRGQPTAGTALIEEYVAGSEFSVETFSTDGEAQHVGVTRKTVSAPPFCVETGHLYPAGLTPAAESALIETTRAVLGALGVRTGPTHTEIKIGPGGGPLPIEVNCRLAGGMIPELIRLACGVDLLEQQLRCAVGVHPDLGGLVPPAWAGIRFLIAERPGVLREVTGMQSALRCPGVVQVRVTATPGTPVNPPPRSAYDRLGFVIAAGDGMPVVTAALAAAGRCLLQVIDAS